MSEKQCFYHWAKGKYLQNGDIFNTSTSEGKFVHDMVIDRDFPWYNKKKNWKDLDSYGAFVTEYLLKRGTDAEELLAFVSLFFDYCENYLGISMEKEKANGQGRIPCLSIIGSLENGKRETEKV